MHSAEKVAFAIRHSKYLEKADWLWNQLRPAYDRASAWVGGGGIERVINGTDRMRLSPRWRMIPEDYEPEVWRALMNQVGPGDLVADIGSFVGLYAIALAKRVGPTGRVFAFEPDVNNHRSLKEHVRLNEVDDRMEVIQAAVAEEEGYAAFASNFDESSIQNVVSSECSGDSQVKCVTIDNYLAGKRLDLMKIDVEGYEEKVLEGASALLKDRQRSPRMIFIEVHPYAWPKVGTTSESLLHRLVELNYQVKDLNGQPIQKIEHYGEIVAHKIGGATQPPGVMKAAQ